MIDFNFNIPSPASVKERLAAGYRARRNYLVLELLSMIVYQTPVKTGKARGGWQVNIGAPVSGNTGRLDKEGSETIMQELAKLKGASPFAAVHLGNTVEYIDDLEQGSSGQAPDGILRVVVPAFRAIYGDVT